MDRSQYILESRRAVAQYGKKQKGKGKKFLRSFILQAIVCGVAFVAVLGMKSADIPVVKDINDGIKYFLTYNVDYMQTVESIKKTYYNYFPAESVEGNGEDEDENI